MQLPKLLQLIKDNAAARASGKPSIRSENVDGEAHVYVYDVIDSWWGANATDLAAQLSGLDGQRVHLHINSPGGDVFEGRAMASAIVAYPGDVVTHIDGLAASAATYLALAAREVRITQGGMLMIHNGWTMGWGNKGELRKTADLLEKIDGQIARDYAAKTGLGVADVAALMDAETWYTEDEALAAKLVDFVDPNTKRDDSASANDEADPGRWNLSAYAHAPKLTPRKPAEPQLDDTAIARQLQMNRNRLRLLDLAA